MEKKDTIRVSPETKGNPCYEVIKKEDLEAAFKDALVKALLEVFSRIDSLIEVVTATAPQGLWTWDYTSRWDYDMFW